MNGCDSQDGGRILLSQKLYWSYLSADKRKPWKLKSHITKKGSLSQLMIFELVMLLHGWSKTFQGVCHSCVTQHKFQGNH